MFSVDVLSRQPIYEQIIRQLERFVLTGVLKPGDQIPSVRSLSMQLSINPNTIQKAYAELDRRGIICSVPGRGCFIAENAVSRLNESKRQELTTFEELAGELALAGMDKDTLLKAVEKAYSAHTGRSEHHD